MTFAESGSKNRKSQSQIEIDCIFAAVAGWLPPAGLLWSITDRVGENSGERVDGWESAIGEDFGLNGNHHQTLFLLTRHQDTGREPETGHREAVGNSSEAEGRNAGFA